jgi:START domain-containing protein
MKFCIRKFTCLTLASLLSVFVFSQWKLSRNSDGIKVYTAENADSKFQKIKVECTLEGNFDKLISVVSDVGRHKEWVYNNKTAYILKKYSANDFIYYTETTIPWPMSNRDAIIHMKITRDSANRFLNIIGYGEPTYIAEKEGKVRVPHTSISWHVTMPTAQSISIVYIIDTDPGGNLPSWLINMFSDKGMFESFKKLGHKLKQV